MSWLRWWDGTCSDPKWRVIAMRSAQPVGSVVAVWAWLLERARQADGDLGEIDAEEIAVTYGYDVDAVSAILAALSDKGLISDGAVKNWRKRQPKREDDSAERVQKFRARKAAKQLAEKSEGNDEIAADTQRNADVTRRNAPEAEAEAENLSLVASRRDQGGDGEKPVIKPKSSKTPPSLFDEFWLAYPKRDGENPKQPARKKFDAAVKSGTDPAAITAGARSYAEAAARRGNVGTPYIAMASTWLNRRGWEDYDAPPQRVVDLKERWRVPVRRWLDDPSTWWDGAPPGEPGCLVPDAVLCEFGIQRRGAA
jgi:hypothetical protein